MKLSVSKKQESTLYVLRLEGLRRLVEMTESTEEYERAKKVEKEVSQYVVDNNEYIAECPDFPEMNGRRITDEFDTCFINENVFVSDYLHKVKAAFMQFYNIDNPLNFVYSSPMLDRKLKAERSYQMIAVDFLKVCGHTEEAETLEKSIKTYLRPELKERLYKINDMFIGGK